MPIFTTGSTLAVDVQRDCLARFVHRYTMQHVPSWARQPMPNGRYYAPQYRTDAEWLANTEFAVTREGRLAANHRYCQSRNQSWPLGQTLDRPYHP